MFQFLLKSLLLYVLLIPLNIAPAWALDVETVRFGAHPDKTRMVIELSEFSEFKGFTLPKADGKPYRLVIELPNFDWQAGAIAKPPKTSVIDVRSGTFTNSTKRIVVDLNKPADMTTAFIIPKTDSKRDRLVIDFKTVSEAQFAKIGRKTFGTLNIEENNASSVGFNNDKTKLNLLISSETLQDIDTLDQNAKGPLVIPQKKPAPPIINATPTRTKSPLRKPLIVIDAGHGGQDPGAIGAGMLKEKNITLSAAKVLKSKLEATGRYKVHLTRDKDIYLKLYTRRGIAHDKDADLFISLHADSIDKANVRGASVYTLSNKASDQQTARLAARENQVDLIAGVDLSHEDKDVANILIDLAMRDTMNQSKFFANTVVAKMEKKGVRLLTRPHRYAGFAVLKSADIPSILVEMGFMSNKGESRLLATKEYQEKIASALTKSIDTYFQKVRQNSVQ